MLEKKKRHRSGGKKGKTMTVMVVVGAFEQPGINYPPPHSPILEASGATWDFPCEHHDYETVAMILTLANDATSGIAINMIPDAYLLEKQYSAVHIHPSRIHVNISFSNQPTHYTPYQTDFLEVRNPLANM